MPWGRRPDALKRRRSGQTGGEFLGKITPWEGQVRPNSLKPFAGRMARIIAEDLLDKGGDVNTPARLKSLVPGQKGDHLWQFVKNLPATIDATENVEREWKGRITRRRIGPGGIIMYTAKTGEKPGYGALATGGNTTLYPEMYTDKGRPPAKTVLHEFIHTKQMAREGQPRFDRRYAAENERASKKHGDLSAPDPVWGDAQHRHNRYEREAEEHARNKMKSVPRGPKLPKGAKIGPTETVSEGENTATIRPVYIRGKQVGEMVLDLDGAGRPTGRWNYTSYRKSDYTRYRY